MKLAIVCLGLSALAPATLWGASCGTVAVPLACGITVGGQVNYLVNNFAFGSNSANGGGNLYVAGDIDIDIASGGGNSLLMTFSKHNGSPTPGIVFLANPGQDSAFSFTYSVTISPAVPGTVGYTTPSIVDFTLSSALGNGFSSSQLILAGAPTSCNTVRNSVSVSQGTCTSLPAVPSLTLNIGSISFLDGGVEQSNTSFGGFTHLFGASFTPGQPVGEVPEPATMLTAAAGLLLLGWQRVRRRR